MTVTQMVLGLAFDDLDRVALIRKLRPDWQAGKFNGIGGKVEADETSCEAMSREFMEETGVHVNVLSWRHIGFMWAPSWHVDIFTYKGAEISQVKTCTDESVVLVSKEYVRRNADVCIGNIPLLIDACSLKDEPYLMLHYKE